MARDKRAQAKDRLTSLLRVLREEAGLRQVDMAARLKLPQSFVSKYESGERRLDLLEIHQICVALKISLTSFARRLEDALNDT